MGTRIYVGNLPLDIRRSELDDLFYKYGKIININLKAHARPPAFAFIAFDDHRGARDAIRGRDNYNFDGYRLRVEFSKGDRRAGGADDRRDNRKTGGRRTEYGVIVSNLPRGCSWQDLKDFMRKAGDVVFTDVERDGEGVVEFSNRDDMEHAIELMDNTEFKSYSDTSIIHVKAANKKRDRSKDDREHHHSSSEGKRIRKQDYSELSSTIHSDTSISNPILAEKTVQAPNIGSSYGFVDHLQQHSSYRQGSASVSNGTNYHDNFGHSRSLSSELMEPSAKDDITAVLPQRGNWERLKEKPAGFLKRLEEDDNTIVPDWSAPELLSSRSPDTPIVNGSNGNKRSHSNVSEEYEPSNTSRTLFSDIGSSWAPETADSILHQLSSCHQSSTSSSSSSGANYHDNFGHSRSRSLSSALIEPDAEDDTAALLQNAKNPASQRMTGGINEERNVYEYFVSQEDFDDVERDLHLFTSKAVYDEMGTPGAEEVDMDYETDYLAYKTVGEALRESPPATRLRDALIAFYHEEWRQQGPTDSLLPRDFFGVAAPSGTGKTQMAFTLKSYEALRVAHIVLCIEKRDGRLNTENMQSIYLHACLFMPSLYLLEAIGRDLKLKAFNTQLERDPSWTPSAEDLLPGGCCHGLLLHTVAALSRMFALLDTTGQPFGTVGALRARLWECVGSNNKGLFRLPVLVLDEMLNNKNPNTRWRCGFLRAVVCAVGIAALFVGTNVEILKPLAEVNVCPEGAAATPWARLATLLPRAHCTADQLDRLKQSENVDAVNFFRAFDTFAATCANSTQCFNALFAYRLWEYFLQEPTRTIDELRCQAAKHLYGEKHLLRSAAGISAQLMYCLGEVPQPSDEDFIHCHFARLEKDGDLDLTPDNKVVLRGTDKEWVPLLAFPSPAVDPLGPLLLGGICTSQTQPAPFELFTEVSIVTLTAAMAVQLHRKRVESIPAIASGHDNLLECAMAAAAVCASQACGINGVRAGDFLLHFAAELLPRAPEQPLQWDVRAPLMTLWSGADSVIPFCSGATTAVYPSSILPNIGRYDRQPGVRGVLRDCHEVGLCTFDTVRAVADGSGESTDECTTLGAAVSHFRSRNVPLGVMVVSPLTGNEKFDVCDDTHVVKMVVDQTKGTVSIAAVGGSDRAGDDSDTAAPKSRILCVFELDLESPEFLEVYEHLKPQRLW